MAQDEEEILVGLTGKIMVAAVGTTEPADESAAWPAGWTDLGFTSEDGPTITDGKTMKEIRVWQMFYAARRLVETKVSQVAFALRQWNADTVQFAFGGGTITEPTAGHFMYEPPAPEEIDDRALGIEWQDGDKVYRWILRRGTVTENVETKINRSDPSDLPITFSLTGKAGEVPWIILTNDPAFEGAGS